MARTQNNFFMIRAHAVQNSYKEEKTSALYIRYRSFRHSLDEFFYLKELILFYPIVGKKSRLDALV